MKKELRLKIEELYNKEEERIKKLSLRYAKMFHIEWEDIYQEGMLALAEAYKKYAEKLTDELLHRIINRRMYKYAREEYRHIIREENTGNRAESNAKTLSGRL